MAEKPLVTHIHTGVSNDLSGSGEALRWRTSMEAHFECSLTGWALLRRVKWVKWEKIVGLVARILSNFHNKWWEVEEKQANDPAEIIKETAIKRGSVSNLRLCAIIVQIFGKNVGDSSCDPLLTLQDNVAKCLGIRVIRKLRLSVKVSARSLVMMS